MSDQCSILVFKNVSQETCLKEADKLKFFLLNHKYVIETIDSKNHIVLKPGILAPQSVKNNIFYGQDLVWNQVEILTGQQIFHENEDAKFFITCTVCNNQVDGFQTRVTDLLSQFIQNGFADYECLDCHHTQSLQLCNTKGFAAGFLGVEFWNWGNLSPDFINQISLHMKSEVTYIESRI